LGGTAKGSMKFTGGGSKMRMSPARGDVGSNGQGKRDKRARTKLFWGGGTPALSTFRTRKRRLVQKQASGGQKGNTGQFLKPVIKSLSKKRKLAEKKGNVCLTADLPWAVQRER